MLLLDGEKVALKRLARLKRVVSTLKRPPTLAIVLAGSDPGSEVYVRQKQRAGEAIGIRVTVHRPKSATTSGVTAIVTRLARDRTIDAILVQLPLPKTVDADAVLALVPASRDVDGLHPLNRATLLSQNQRFVPPAAAGIIALLDEYDIALSGVRVAIWGRGDLIGRPLAALLLDRGAWVSWIHRGTKDAARVSAEADIVIAATGAPKLVGSSMVKRGAVVVDAGWSRIGQRITGDVDFASVSRKARAITPVPGGVGPMTVAMLMENVVRAYEMRLPTKLSSKGGPSFGGRKGYKNYKSE